ncbi:hypothetical protein [Maritimibacter sp. UBA3975]|uniref:hypothetical protein n=1 Tax=Maritimibacter sp. UBA3975 TaxID=1946833 RepID=UPI000C0B4B00|nr:hypothetical protein [Maritimibacter sp. UBA3975]MAM60754.1 hypothetical protein [Maritimibacter sp.]|tara:strand:- start:13668 stop:13853 length:186 start_codon:yes stop_codon:yes gene_type:complete
MTQIRATHEIHGRRLSRNIGLGIVLVAFVGIVYGLTIAKVGTDPNDDLGAPWAQAQDKAAK